MNKKEMKQIRIIGKEIRERFFLALLGLSMLVGFVSIGYFSLDIEPAGFLEILGYIVVVLVEIFLLLIGFVIICISFSNEGFNSEDEKNGR